MKNEDLWKVMRWIGYVYVPIAIIFIAVYLFVAYRERIAREPYPIPTSAGISTSAI